MSGGEGGDGFLLKIRREGGGGSPGQVWPGGCVVEIFFFGGGGR